MNKAVMFKACSASSLFLLGAVLMTVLVDNTSADAFRNSSCYFCDYNNGDCRNPDNWAVQACNDYLPCYKNVHTASRGCAPYPSCTASNNIRDTDFEWNAPWRWIWKQLYVLPHDCFSESHGCHEWFCCRDKDKCNSAVQRGGSVWLQMASFASLITAIYLKNKLL